MTSEVKRREFGVFAELALVFLKLGFTAFGGPVAHISLMEREFVHRRKWLDSDELMDLISASNLIPGPNSTELALHLGRSRGGGIGLLIAGLCFIAPSVILTAAAAWGYVRFGKIPEIHGFLYGVKPVIVAVVVQALLRLGGSALKTPLLVVVCVAGGILCFLGVNEIAILFGTGILLVAIRTAERRNSRNSLPLLSVGGFSCCSLFAAIGAPINAVPLSVPYLFAVFLKIGSVLFGSGYVLIAFLRADFVDRLGWITESQLIDAIAVGQMTPGPLLSSATFLGYLLEGPIGGLAATTAIFMPAFVFVWLSGPLIPRLRRYAPAAAFLDGANGASFALIAVASFRFGVASIIDWKTGFLFLAATVSLHFFRLNSAWLILASGSVGAALYQ